MTKLLNKLLDITIHSGPAVIASWSQRLLKLPESFVKHVGCGILAVTVTTGVVYGVYTVYLIYDDLYGTSVTDLSQYMLSVVSEKFSRSYHYECLRMGFREAYKPASLRLNKSHPHPTAAMQRKAADFGIQQLIRQLGYSEYPISASRRDTRVGSHTWWWGRDLAFSPVNRRLEEQEVIKLIDVDYYMDMPSLIARRRPIMMYTFIPMEASGQTDDGVYWIDNDSVIYRVTGGATYEHEIWDYDQDMVAVDSICGTTVATIDVKMLGPNGRCVICITPVRFVYWPFSLLVKGGRLYRQQFTFNGVNMVRRMDEKGTYISLARNASAVSVSLPEDVFLSCAIRYEKSTKPSISDLERMLGASKCSEPHLMAALLFDLLDTPRSEIMMHLYREQYVPTFMALPETGQVVTEDQVTRGRVTTGPLGDATAVTPAICVNNERSAVEGRVLKQLNTAEPPQRYHRYASEFMERLLPVAGIGAPNMAYEVFDQQDGHFQRARNEREWYWISALKKLRVNIFVKAEAYSTATDPRVISSVDPNHNMSLSCYTYAFKEQVLKRFPWYAPARTPEELEALMLGVCYRNLVVELDYSRFDGTISKWLRVNVEQAAYLRWVNSVYHAELRLLLEKEVCVTTTTHSGVRSKTNGQRLSGSPLTTDGNTLINAFVAYAARRDSGKEPDVAFAHLGLFAGDDGIALTRLSDLENSSRHLGLKLDAREVVGGRLMFLGRAFYDPCNGDVRSIQDPDRTIRKLHFTFSPHYISQEQALVNKAHGYLTLDPEAPLVSDWCRKILELLPALTPYVDPRDMPFNAKAIFAQGARTWTQLDIGHGVDLCAEVLCCGSGDVVEWMSKIKAAQTLEDLVGIVHLPSPKDKKGHYVIQTMLPIQGGIPAPPIENDADDTRSVKSDQTHVRKRRGRAGRR